MGLTHYLLDLTIEQQQDAATVVNIAGRQRMLSQRAALLAQDLELGNQAARTPLLDTIGLMERAHNALTKRNDLGIHTPLSERAAAYYFEGQHPLDGIVRTYIRQVRQFMAMPPGAQRDAAHAELHKAALSTVLDALNDAVLIFTDETNRKNERILWEQRALLGVLLITLIMEAFCIFKPMALRINSVTERLRNEAAYDALTGLLARRHFFESSERLLLLARRIDEPCSAILLDIDKFKLINDTHGHAIGDIVLQRLAEVIRRTVRRSDLIGRIGGEEFALVLPNTNMHTALNVAEKLRRSVQQEKTRGVPAFTISAGVAELGIGDFSTKELLERADRALYLAKDHGRNRIGFHRIGEREPQLMSNDPFALMTLASSFV